MESRRIFPEFLEWTECTFVDVMRAAETLHGVLVQCLCAAWMLLEDIVNEDLKEDEENNDDEVALLQQEAALCPACSLTSQHADAPANTASIRYDKRAVM